MKKHRKSVTNAVTPARVCFPPVPWPKDRPALELKGPSPREVRFPETSLKEAETLTEELVRECEKLFRAGRPEYVVKLVADHISLVADSRVSKILAKLAEHGRLKNPPGRPKSVFIEHPLVVAALVRQVISEGKVPDQERAFHWLVKMGISASTARDLFYKAEHDRRFQVLFIKHEEQLHMATPHDIAMTKRARALVPGSKVVWAIEHPLVGKLEVSIEANS